MVIQASERPGLSVAADGFDETKRVLDFEGHAPIEKLNRIETAVATKRLVDRGPRLAELLRQRPDG